MPIWAIFNFWDTLKLRFSMIFNPNFQKLMATQILCSPISHWQRLKFSSQYCLVMGFFLFSIYRKPHLMKKENFQSLSMGHWNAQNPCVSLVLSLKIRNDRKFGLKITKNRDFGVISKALKPIQTDENVSNRHFWKFLGVNYQTHILRTDVQKFCRTVSSATRTSNDRLVRKLYKINGTSRTP